MRLSRSCARHRFQRKYPCAAQPGVAAVERGSVLLALHPAGGRPRGDGWARCVEQRAAIERWLGDGLRLTKIRKLLVRQGVLIAYPTLFFDREHDARRAVDDLFVRMRWNLLEAPADEPFITSDNPVLIVDPAKAAAKSPKDYPEEASPSNHLAAAARQRDSGWHRLVGQTHFMHRVLSASLIGFTVIAAIACRASYPAAPTDSTPVGFQIYFRSPVGFASVGSSYRFDAYTLRADGAYEDVTMQATWSSSDPAVLRPNVITTGGFPGVFFVAAAPGSADVIARYQGFSSSLPMFAIRSDRLVYPRLSLTLPLVLSWTPGQRGQAGARMEQSTTVSEAVTDLASWSSSDTEILTVDRGLLTAIAPGTVQIRASFNGLSAFFGISVHPRRQVP